MISDIPLCDIKASMPVLIIYPTGTGGEHLAHTLSVCCDDFQTLDTYYNNKVNQFHTSCFINYSADIVDVDDFNSALHECYNTDYKDNSKRLIFKDHPTQRTLDFYKKHLPNIRVIFIAPFNEQRYFATLTFKKLAKQIKSIDVNYDFIKSQIGRTLDENELAYILSEVNKYKWVWVHEIHTLVNDMRNNAMNAKLHHYDNIDNIIEDHYSYLININNEVIPHYLKSFNDFHLLNCDDLKSDGLKFWKLFHLIEPTVDLNKAATITNKWITRNNKLMQLETC